MSPQHAEVVIAGGGVGGLTTAHRLRRKAPQGTRVVLIEPNKEFVFAPDLLWVLAGARRPEQFTKAMEKMVPREVEHLSALVLGFDPDNRSVSTSAGDITYDRLVVALGANTVPGSLVGFREAAHDLYRVDGALAAHEALCSISEGRVVLLVSRLPFKCPAAPYEAAFIADHMLAKRKVRDAVSIEIVTPEPLPMPTAGRALGHRVAAMLADRGIRFRPATTVESIDPGSQVLNLASGGSLPFDLLLGVPPHQPPPALAESPLAGASGYVPIDPRTLATSHQDVYAIGDAAALPIPDDKFLPKAGVFAHAHGKIVANRIADELAGREPKSEFDGTGSCFLELGGKRAARASGTFTASPPQMRMNMPGWWWHAAKVGLEQYWLHPRLWR